MKNKWSKNKIIEDICKLSNLQQNNVRNTNYLLYVAAYRYFGSWKNAVEKAGFDYDNIKIYNTWDKDKILNNIKTIKNLTDSYISEHHKSLYMAAIREFGSWRLAVEKIGINYVDKISKYKKNWTESEIIDEIKKMENKTDLFVSNNNKSLYMATLRKFGSWKNGVDKAGFIYDEIKHSYTNEDKLYKVLISIFKDIKRHYKFEWLVYKRSMHIDFYIPKLKLAIERHGEQHYRPVCFGGISEKRAINNLKIVNKRDKHKAHLLKQNGIKLLIIPYDEKITAESIKRKIKCL